MGGSDGPIDTVDDFLVTTESSATPLPIDDIAVVARIPDDEQATLRIAVEYFENDPAGPQVSEQDQIDLTWYPDLGCWASPYYERPVCITDASFGYELPLEDGGECDVVLAWRILLDG